MLNTWTPNSKPLNARGGTPGIEDWTLTAPVERQTVYLLDIDGLRVPISSAQATMRSAGQGFLQAVVPNGAEYIEALEGLPEAPMRLLTGYRFADGTLSQLEEIAEAPFQLLRRDEGGTRDTLTLSGYGPRTTSTSATRDLVGVQTRSTGTNARRRVRAEIDLFLRPGHTARDSDGVEFEVGIIQYFINDVSEAMEVIQDG